MAKEDIRIAAREAANTAELSLIDMLNMVQRVAEFEKTAVTGGVDPKDGFNNTLLEAAQRYQDTRSGVATLKKIAKGGAKAASKYELAALLNYPFTHAQTDQSPMPIFKFVQDYKAELVEAVTLAAHAEAGNHFQNISAEQWLKTNVRDYKLHSGSGGPPL